MDDFISCVVVNLSDSENLRETFEETILFLHEQAIVKIFQRNVSAPVSRVIVDLSVPLILKETVKRNEYVSLHLSTFDRLFHQSVDILVAHRSKSRHCLEHRSLSFCSHMNITESPVSVFDLSSTSSAMMYSSNCLFWSFSFRDLAESHSLLFRISMLVCRGKSFPSILTLSEKFPLTERPRVSDESSCEFMTSDYEGFWISSASEVSSPLMRSVLRSRELERHLSWELFFLSQHHHRSSFLSSTSVLAPSSLPPPSVPPLVSPHLTLINGPLSSAVPPHHSSAKTSAFPWISSFWSTSPLTSKWCFDPTMETMESVQKECEGSQLFVTEGNCPYDVPRSPLTRQWYDEIKTKLVLITRELVTIATSSRSPSKKQFCRWQRYDLLFEAPKCAYDGWQTVNEVHDATYIMTGMPWRIHGQSTTVWFNVLAFLCCDVSCISQTFRNQTWPPPFYSGKECLRDGSSQRGHFYSTNCVRCSVYQILK